MNNRIENHMVISQPNDETFKVYAWCDGTWCYPEALHEYSYMSDDYTELHVPYGLDDTDADEYIHMQMNPTTSKSK